MLILASTELVTASRKYAICIRNLKDAHNVGLICCIALIALILFLECALLYEQSHDKVHYSGRSRVFFALACVVIFGFMLASENGYTLKYRHNLKLAKNDTTAVINTSNLSKTKNQKLQHRVKQYKAWLKLN